jgi:hypothetical protein
VKRPWIWADRSPAASAGREDRDLGSRGARRNGGLRPRHARTGATSFRFACLASWVGVGSGAAVLLRSFLRFASLCSALL